MSDIKEGMEDAGDKMKKGAKKTGDKMEDGAQETKEKVDKNFLFNIQYLFYFFLHIFSLINNT
jgi:hypothetical protein